MEEKKESDLRPVDRRLAGLADWRRVFSGQWHVKMMSCYCLRIHEHNPRHSRADKICAGQHDDIPQRRNTRLRSDRRFNCMRVFYIGLPIYKTKSQAVARIADRTASQHLWGVMW